MRTSVALAFLVSLFSAVAHAQQERIIVLPVEAIADSAKLEKEQFFERYPGIDATQFGLTDEGWYVRYQHEMLTYLYGPIDDLTYARRQKKLLEEIRLSLVLKSPSLSSSQISIIRFDFGATPSLGEEAIEDNPYIIPDTEKPN